MDLMWLTETWWGLLILVVILVFFLFEMIKERKCPECGRKGALEKTGRKRQVPGSEPQKWLARFLSPKPDEREFKCKYCDYITWKIA